MTSKSSPAKPASWADFFIGRAQEVPCLGLEIGRESFWIARMNPKGEAARLEWCEKRLLPQTAFSGAPTGGFSSELAKALKPFFSSKEYEVLQVALPDPAVRLEVFEVEKVPASQKDLREFLEWRFNQGKEGEKQPLAFTTQILGVEEGKTLLLSMAVDSRWLDSFNQAFLLAGIRPSTVDMAFSHRFNFFHGTFKEKGASGALLTLEPGFWSLGVWDKDLRPRFVRSKWWDKECSSLKDLPLQETILEVERNIRSYVHSGKNRSVEALYVAGPEDWLPGITKALAARTGGSCTALSLGTRVQNGSKEGWKGFAPSAVTAGVAR